MAAGPLRGGAGRWAVVAVYAGLALSVAAVFAPSLRCDFTGYDDPGYVLENARVSEGLTAEGVRWAFTTTAQANWHPLTWLSLMADVSLWGRGPAGFHATSVTLHALAALLLLHALRRATGELARPAAVAALVALHPLRVESVTWIAERKDVLAAVFWMAAMLAWVRYRLRPGALRYATVLGAVTLGLLAKPTLVTLPFALALLEVWPLGGSNGLSGPREPAAPFSWRRTVLALAPLGLLSAASCAVTLWAQRAGGAMGSFESFPLGTRVANAVLAAALYLTDLGWPSGLAVPYPYDREALTPGALAAAAAALVVLTAAALLPARRRPWGAVGWLWFLGTLVPVLGLVQVGAQARADRYTYLPSVGIALWVVWEAGELARRALPAVRPRQLAAGAAAALVLGALSAVTWTQQAHWRDGAALMRRALAVTARNAVAHDGYGLELHHAGRTAEALPHFEDAVRLAPGYVEARINLAAALSGLSRHAEAAEQLREVVRQRPGDLGSRAGLAEMLLRVGESAEAEARAREVLAASPGDRRAQEVLGVVQALRGEAAGEAPFRRAEEEGRAGELHVAIGLSLLRDGKTAEAERELREAVRVSPSLPAAHTNLGVVLARTGRLDEALAHFEEAVRLAPDDEGARANLDRARRRVAGEGTFGDRHQ